MSSGSWPLPRTSHWPFADEDVIDANHFGHWIPIVLILVTVRVVWDVRLGSTAGGWRFASVPDLERLHRRCRVWWDRSRRSRSSPAPPPCSCGPGVTRLPLAFVPARRIAARRSGRGACIGIRAASDWSPSFAPRPLSDRRATLFYGAGRSGERLPGQLDVTRARALCRSGSWTMIPALAGRVVADLRVFGGLDALDQAIATTGAEALLITMPGASGKAIRSIVDAAMARGLEVRTVPSMNDLLDGTLAAYRIRRVRVEDLLRRTDGNRARRRRPRDPSRSDRLITGAGGRSVLEFARQVLALRPRRLILLDRAESALFDIHVATRARRIGDQGAGELRARPRQRCQPSRDGPSDPRARSRTSSSMRLRTSTCP